MGRIIKSKKHLYIRVPIILLSIFLFAISPVFISVIGAQITEAMTNEPCHEGNCFWGAFGWLTFLTMPIAGVLFIIFLIIVIIDVSKLAQK
jgi:ABC-type multidrug transport system fused ATPase/permease subunit